MSRATHAASIGVDPPPPSVLLLHHRGLRCISLPPDVSWALLLVGKIDLNSKFSNSLYQLKNNIRNINSHKLLGKREKKNVGEPVNPLALSPQFRNGRGKKASKLAGKLYLLFSTCYMRRSMLSYHYRVALLVLLLHKSLLWNFSDFKIFIIIYFSFPRTRRLRRMKLVCFKIVIGMS